MKLLLPAPYFHQTHTSLKCSLQPCNPAQWSSVCGLSTAIHEKRQRRHQNLHLELAKTWAYRLYYAARMYINVHIIYCQIHQEKKNYSYLELRGPRHMAAKNVCSRCFDDFLLQFS